MNDLTTELTHLKINNNSKILPIYIGIDIPDEIMNTIPFNYISFFRNKKINNEFHITLKFKPTNKDLTILPEEGILCNVYIDGIGYSSNSICIKVDKILSIDNIIIPSFQIEGIPLHITIALSDSTKPVNSYLSLSELYQKFDEQLILSGNIKYYYTTNTIRKKNSY
jgi:hypothetical protein